VSHISKIPTGVVDIDHVISALLSGRVVVLVGDTRAVLITASWPLVRDHLRAQAREYLRAQALAGLRP
jgi:hypothetical protein